MIETPLPLGLSHTYERTLKRPLVNDWMDRHIFILYSPHGPSLFGSTVFLATLPEYNTLPLAVTVITSICLEFRFEAWWEGVNCPAVARVLHQMSQNHVIHPADKVLKQVANMEWFDGFWCSHLPHHSPRRRPIKFRRPLRCLLSR